MPVLETLALGALAIQAASAIGQALNSSAARDMASDEKAKLASMMSKIQSPQFRPSDFTTEEYAVVSKYVPEAAQYIEATNPRVVEASGVGATRGREAQMAALQRLTQVGQGQDPYQQAVIEQAAQQASQAAEASRQQALQSMARRGISGGGLELASTLAGQSQAYGRAADVGLQGGMERYRQGLEALYRGADIGRQVRAEDVALEQANADIINRFNQEQTAYKRGLEAQRVAAQNQANMYNQELAQRIAEANVSGRNQAKQAYRDWKQQDYANQIKKAGMMSGVTQMNVEDIVGRAQDKNQMIQGLGNVATGAIAAANPQRFNPVTGQAYYDPYSGKSMALPQEEVPQQKLPPPKELDASIYDKPYTV